MSPPALRWEYHARPDGLIAGWLMVYESATPGVQMGHNASIRLDLKNEPQPDAALIIDPACGGQVRISDDGYVEGARNCLSKFPAAASVLISTQSSVHTDRMACGSTWFGGSLIVRSIGSRCMKASSYRSRQMAAGSFGARCFQDSGLTSHLRFNSIRRRCCEYYRKGWQQRSTRRSSPRCKAAANSAGGAFAPTWIFRRPPHEAGHGREWVLQRISLPARGSSPRQSAHYFPDWCRS
jgi:hypothetical protein